MGNGGVSFRRRIILMILEILVVLLLVFVIFVLIMSMLYGQRIVNSVHRRDELEASQIVDARNASQYLEELGVNFVIFDSQGQIKKQKLSDHYLSFAREAYEQEEVLEDVSGEYLPYINDSSAVIVRIPYIPEFVNMDLESRHPFNHLFNRSLVLVCLLISLLPIIRFMRQIKDEFLELQRTIFGPLDDRGHSLPQLIEIQESMRQVTSMKRLLIDLIEEEKLQKKDLLFQTAALSHDIKTPLTIIKGNVGLLEYCDDQEEEDECITSINGAIATIESYLDTMLAHSQRSYSLDDKRLVLVIDLIEEITSDLQDYSKDIPFIVTNNIADSNLQITCAKDHVRRAVINLLINAFEHARTQVIMRIDDHEGLTFHIYNDGAGIKEDMFEHLGKLFYSGDKGRNNHHYGIGLFFAQSVANAHGGELTYENLAEGVKFSLSIRDPS